MRKIPETINLILCYNNFKPKAPLGNCVVKTLTNNIGEPKNLQFSINQKIFINGETVENPSYESVKVEQLVLLENYGYYVVKSVSITENGEGIEKVVECSSIEVKLSKKMVVLPHKVIQLRKNELDDEDGIFDIFEQYNPGWKVTFIQEEAQYDFINGGKLLKYRNIEVNETWLNFLTQTIQEAYDIVLFFDHLNRTISVYSRLHLGETSKLILSRRNYIDTINKTFDNTDIITRLHVEPSGEEGKVSIASVNPLGTNYIEDFSHFQNSEYMSKELIDALDIYYPLLDARMEEWYEENDILLSMQEEDLDLQVQIDKKKEELKAKKHIQNEAIKMENGEPDSEKLKEIKEIIDVIENEIAVLEEEKKLKEEEITKQTELLTDLSLSMQRENIELNGIKLFDEELLNELENFIFEGSWSNECYTSDLTLFMGAKEQIKKVSKPTFTISIGLNQLAITEFQDLTLKPLYDLGDFVSVENNEMEIKKPVRYLYQPLIQGSRKRYQLLISDNKELVVNEKFESAERNFYLKDIYNRTHQIFITDNGNLCTQMLYNKKESQEIRLGDSKGNIYKLKIDTEGTIFFEDTDDNIKIPNADMEKVRIVGYTYNAETEQTDITLSTEEFSLTQEGKISQEIAGAIQTGKVFNKNKLTIEQAKETNNWVENYYKNSLDVALKNIYAAMGNNSIEISENGIILRDIRNWDDIVMLSVGGIILSKDNLETVKTAITADGVTAEQLIGQIILGKQVYIADENGELEIKGNLLTIRDNLKRERVRLGEYTPGDYGLEIIDTESNKTVLNSKGILQRERFSFSQNLDENYSHIEMLPIDAGLSEIRQADLWVTPTKFRAYSKTATGGGGKFLSDDATETITSGPSSASTSYVNINNSSGSGQWGSGSYGTGWATGWDLNGRLQDILGGTHKHYIGFTSTTGSTLAKYIVKNVDSNNSLIPEVEIPVIDIFMLGSGDRGGVSFRAISSGKDKNKAIYTFTNSLPTYGLRAESLLTDDNDPIQQLINVLHPKVINAKSNIMLNKREEISLFELETDFDKTIENVIKEPTITEAEYVNVISYAMARANSDEHTHPIDHYHSNQHSHKMLHTHQLNHTHTYRVPDHDHTLEFGIWEDNILPVVNVEARVDGGAWEKIVNGITGRAKVNMLPYLNRVNEQGKDNIVEIRITSSTRARVDGAMLMKAMTRF